jgi:hypothetical protein
VIQGTLEVQENAFWREFEMKKLTATYDKDSKKFHRFLIDDGQGVVGTIYIPKNDNLPEQISIILTVKKDQN